jgi:hypothetical protein
MLQNFSTLGFPVVVSGQIVIPDQVKVLKSYKKRLQKMTAAQKDANGNFKSNPEAEVAQDSSSRYSETSSPPLSRRPSSVFPSSCAPRNRQSPCTISNDPSANLPIGLKRF